MDDWRSYSPDDLLLFSADAYWRLFELVNRDAWPAQPAIIVLSAVLIAIAATRRNPGLPACAAALAAAWWWTAGDFLAERYAAINWAAAPAVRAFEAQSLLLALLALWTLAAPPARGRAGARDRIALGLAVWAVVLHPLLAPLAGRPPAQAEVMGLAPDPTAIATLALATAIRGRAAAALLLPVPAAWCLASGATLLVLGSPQGAVPLAAAAVALLARTLK